MNDTKISSAVNIMIQTERLHKQLLGGSVAAIGMHRTHHRVLMYLARNKKPNSQKLLAEHMGITPAAITGVLKKLEKDGYITREQGSDNRFNEVKITPRGKRVVEDTYALFLQIDTSLFDGFTEPELDGYIGYLEKINENIKKRLQINCENRREGKDKNEKMV